MKKSSHLRVANRVLERSGKKLRKKCKVAFLFGNIAPDLYIIFKAHMCGSTLKNVRYHIEKLSILEDKNKYSVMYYFRLGMIMHYICDYYCRAHNELSVVQAIKHKKYERGLGKYIKEHRNIKFKEFTSTNKERDILKIIESAHEEYVRGFSNKVHSYYKDLLMSLSVNSAIFKICTVNC